MAQFRGTVQGNRGEASRLGNKSSGLTVTCNGWNMGVKVVATYDNETDTDVFKVYKTGGSHSPNGVEVAKFEDLSRHDK